MGWVLLSAKTDVEIEQLRRRANAGGGPKLSHEALMERVNEVRVRGYAFSKHTVSEGAGIIAALLPRGPFGRTFALGVGGPVARLEQKEALIVSELKAGVARLTCETPEA
jgi:DNA-binding IclR family transcriptional regulator